ncbi:MAG: hypothetical protein ACRDWY_07375 [Actinomycetes bacterium]
MSRRSRRRHEEDVNQLSDEDDEDISQLSDEEKTARLSAMFAPTSNMFTIENQIEMLGRLSGNRPRRGTRSREAESQRAVWQLRWFMRAVTVSLVLVSAVVLLLFVIMVAD